MGNSTGPSNVSPHIPYRTPTKYGLGTHFQVRPGHAYYLQHSCSRRCVPSRSK